MMELNLTIVFGFLMWLMVQSDVLGNPCHRSDPCAHTGTNQGREPREFCDSMRSMHVYALNMKSHCLGIKNNMSGLFDIPRTDLCGSSFIQPNYCENFPASDTQMIQERMWSMMFNLKDLIDFVQEGGNIGSGTRHPRWNTLRTLYAALRSDWQDATCHLKSGFGQTSPPPVAGCPDYATIAGCSGDIEHEFTRAYVVADDVENVMNCFLTNIEPICGLN